MKRILAAIASALRSSVSFIWDKCAKTGAWTLRAITGTGGTPAAGPGPLQELEEAMAADLLATTDTGVPPAAGGDGYDRIQRVCRDMNSGIKPKDEDLAELSPATLEWLKVLDPQMKLLVGNVPREALIDHMKGKKGLRGVVCSDRESVKAYSHALEIERVIAEINDPDNPEQAPALAI